ncbi:MAG TPA: metalloregulator ArsR/SmtB family transcription factor [Actinophytocola sp.]|nr:metalloregulator ArsR/SmtB family transcription factor [Actinophytocola sp.]
MSDAGAETDVQSVLEALSSPVRREILWLIWREELPAGQIAAGSGVTAPTVSEHLRVLRRAGLVNMRVDGTFRRYRARQDGVRGLQAMLLGETQKWIPADDVRERSRAQARTVPAVVASAEVACDPATAFTAFTDADLYSRWLGVPVTIDDGRFACTLEWGTQVRGWYEHVLAPTLIVMRWDFDDERVPLPGRELTAYWRSTATEAGCRVEVHQLVDDTEQAQFMRAAWTMVLGRLVEGLPAALADTAAPARPARPKRRRPAGK